MRTWKIVNFAVPVDERVKLKESEKSIRTSTPQGNWKNCKTNYYVIVIGQNTEKSPEDLRRFAVTQTPVKDH